MLLGILPSVVDRLMMSLDKGLAGLCVADQEACRHMMADLNRVKFSQSLISWCWIDSNTPLLSARVQLSDFSHRCSRIVGGVGAIHNTGKEHHT